MPDASAPFGHSSYIYSSVAPGRMPLSRRRHMDTPAGRLAACTGLLATGVAEAALAFGWGHTFGIAVGLASVACGAVFAASSSAQAERALTAWGFVAPSHSLSDSTRPRLTRRGQWAAIMCFTASAMLITVRLLSPDPAWRSFPAACPATLPEGCSRSSARAPHGFAPPLLPLVLRAKATSVAAAVRGWSASSDAPTRGTFLLEGSHPPPLLHFRFVSRLWGFADDFIVDLSACGDGTRVQAHSQLRLGYGDMGVNAARIQALWRHLETAFDSAERSCET